MIDVNGNFSRSDTYFCDLDGTLVKFEEEYDKVHFDPEFELTVLDGVIETLHKLKSRGDIIIITTARSPDSRDATVKQLNRAGIIYDALVMGITTGTRIVINDDRPNSSMATAMSFTVTRNRGLGVLEEELFGNRGKTKEWRIV